jgi:hypothetical protein
MPCRLSRALMHACQGAQPPLPPPHRVITAEAAALVLQALDDHPEPTERRLAAPEPAGCRTAGFAAAAARLWRRFRLRRRLWCGAPAPHPRPAPGAGAISRPCRPNRRHQRGGGGAVGRQALAMQPGGAPAVGAEEKGAGGARVAGAPAPGQVPEELLPDDGPERAARLRQELHGQGSGRRAGV